MLGGGDAAPAFERLEVSVRPQFMRVVGGGTRMSMTAMARMPPKNAAFASQPAAAAPKCWERSADAFGRISTNDT